MLPNLSLLERYEATLVVRRWYTTLDISDLMMFSNTAALLHRHKVAPIIGWEAVVSMLDQWMIFLEVILGTVDGHPAVYKLSMLIDSVGQVSACLR